MYSATATALVGAPVVAFPALAFGMIGEPEVEVIVTRPCSALDSAPIDNPRRTHLTPG
jgi:hypothetical protein